MKSNYKYFKVSSLILETDIKKSELWTYLTHCRARGNQTKGYSIAGLKKTRGIFGNKANKRAYDMSIKSLIEKGLIEEVNAEDEGINTTWYKTDKAINIIESEKGKSIQLPRELLDNKLIVDMSVSEIITVIELYSHYEPLKALGGIDDKFIYAYSMDYDKGYHQIDNSVFGGGFNRTIKGKKMLKIVDYDEIDSEIDFDILDKLLKLRLFNFKPVIIEEDCEDDSLYELSYEIFEGLVSFNNNGNEDLEKNYIISELEENQNVIWILEPLYRPNTVVCNEYLSHRATAEQQAVLLYCKIDKLTQREHIRYALYDSFTYEQIEGEIDDKDFIHIESLGSELQDMSDGLGGMELAQKRIELESLRRQEEEEDKSIQDNNNRLTKAGTRTRKTTSPKLKAIKTKTKEVSEFIEQMESLETDLLELIPSKAIEYFMHECEGYEVENVGKATRFI